MSLVSKRPQPMWQTMTITEDLPVDNSFDCPIDDVGVVVDVVVVAVE